MTRHGERGAEVYRWRKAIVEPVFGQITPGRGFRQFLLRGVQKVRAEWAVVCLTHTILRCDAVMSASGGLVRPFAVHGRHRQLGAPRGRAPLTAPVEPPRGRAPREARLLGARPVMTQTGS